MKINTKDLLTAKNYAIKRKIAVQTAYKWLEKGLIQGVEIDGVKFIVKEKKP